nr:immunoglobulin light chain junction region [Macaca mulatta]MOX52654.1 immunoglobulin light chain junction region [Macaca mulatta]MOX52807.1 immunoglobulin light chain junction region [Macaca mulatta]MOX52915.1 immunoglobulin light chain junction region [Macaca mulatta]MOX53150.1 immunoglobulin light chain junction region [Macaca mulatta]
CQQHKLYPVTF